MVDHDNLDILINIYIHIHTSLNDVFFGLHLLIDHTGQENNTCFVNDHIRFVMVCKADVSAADSSSTVTDAADKDSSLGMYCEHVLC